MLDYHLFNLVQLAGGKAIIGGQQDRSEPKLGLICGRFDMNMRWFLPFVAEKVESKPANA